VIDEKYWDRSAALAAQQRCEAVFPAKRFRAVFNGYTDELVCLIEWECQWPEFLELCD
jgi:hypothetical protein